jgi:hypothetical protein
MLNGGSSESLKTFFKMKMETSGGGETSSNDEWLAMTGLMEGTRWYYSVTRQEGGRAAVQLDSFWLFLKIYLSRALLRKKPCPFSRVNKPQTPRSTRVYLQTHDAHSLTLFFFFFLFVFTLVLSLSPTILKLFNHKPTRLGSGFLFLLLLQMHFLECSQSLVYIIRKTLFFFCF